MNAGTTASFERARRYVEKIPGAISGQGGHDQTFAVVCVLMNGFALNDREALEVLREYNQHCQPPWSERELQHKIESAANATHSKPRGHLLGTECPFKRTAFVPRPSVQRRDAAKIDPVSAVETFLKGFRCDDVDLWEASAIRPPDDWTTDAVALLECLYRSGEKINFVTAFMLNKDGKAVPMGKGETAERDALIARWKTAGMPQSEAGGWLRMNPLDGTGITDAHVSAFRFALVECDGVPIELQLPLLAKLPLPIAAILSSGARSLHAWVQVDAATVEDYRQIVARMLALLGKFGVDGKNKNPSRLSRLPGVVRHIGAHGDGRQRLLYLNPDPKQRAIL